MLMSLLSAGRSTGAHLFIMNSYEEAGMIGSSIDVFFDSPVS